MEKDNINKEIAEGLYIETLKHLTIFELFYNFDIDLILEMYSTFRKIVRKEK